MFQVSLAAVTTPGDPAMMNRKHVSVFGRRDVLLGAGAATLVTAFLRTVPEAGANEKSAQFKGALKALLGNANPISGGIKMDLPNAVENGGYVPLSLAVESPMTEAAKSHNATPIAGERVAAPKIPATISAE